MFYETQAIQEERREPSDERIITDRKVQANKSIRRMPWHQEPMKDVISCEKLWGAANKH